MSRSLCFLIGYLSGVLVFAIGLLMGLRMGAYWLLGAYAALNVSVIVCALRVIEPAEAK